MQIAIRHSYEPPVFSRPDLVVFFDVFRASTTLLALLESGCSHILSANDQETVSYYQAAGYILVSEVFSGGLDNSPTQVRASQLAGRKVIHKSTNLTNAIFAHQGADRSLIGAFVNAAHLVSFIREQDVDTVELIPAGHFHRGTEALEDSVCARMVAQRLSTKPPMPLDLSGVHAKVEAKRLQHGETIASHYWLDTALALQMDAIPRLAQINRLGPKVLEVLEISGS